MDKVLTLLRGLPGSGKSTLSKLFDFDVVYEADSYFMVYRDPITGELVNRYQYNGVYEFDASKLGEAHKECLAGVEDAMQWEYSKIAVSNTLTTEKELKPYYELAEKYGYMVVSLVVENRHGGKNIHNVPEETLDKMEKRFTLKLR